MIDISAQLKDYMKSKGYTEKDIAEKLGVSHARVNQLMTGKKPFGKKAAEQWHNLFGLNEYFLLTGKGDISGSVQQGSNNTSVGNHSINNSNNNNGGDTMQVILRLTKMLEQERADNERLRAELEELRKKTAPPSQAERKPFN